MKLVVISHTPHFKKGDTVVGWGPTVREIDYLAQLFDEVVHIAPLHSESPSQSEISYGSDQVRFIPVPPSGGLRIVDKLRILSVLPVYARTISRELHEADAVHVRCPASISLLAILLLAMKRSPSLRWAKYAGNWQPTYREPWSYKFQRWFLRHGLHRGIVTINGQWPKQPGHVHSFFNPCLTDQELNESKLLTCGKHLSNPIRLFYVGRLEAAKGVNRTLSILVRLRDLGLSVRLDLVGDGPRRAEYETLTHRLGVSNLVSFHGWVPRTGLNPLYAQAHFMVFPSNTEGWPKVLSEAMAYGVIPISSNVGSIPYYLRVIGAGKAYDPADVEGFASAVVWYHSHPDMWKKESENAARAADLFSYGNYIKRLLEIIDLKADHKTSSKAEMIIG